MSQENVEVARRVFEALNRADLCGHAASLRTTEGCKLVTGRSACSLLTSRRSLVEPGTAHVVLLAADAESGLIARTRYGLVPLSHSVRESLCGSRSRGPGR